MPFVALGPRLAQKIGSLLSVVQGSAQKVLIFLCSRNPFFPTGYFLFIHQPTRLNYALLFFWSKDHFIGNILDFLHFHKKNRHHQQQKSIDNFILTQNPTIEVPITSHHKNHWQFIQNLAICYFLHLYIKHRCAIVK
jgi:hypothetical protein